VLALVSVAFLAGFGVIVVGFRSIGSDALAPLACWSRHRLRGWGARLRQWQRTAIRALIVTALWTTGCV